MILTLLMLHGLASVVLIGAITHQALSFWKPAPGGAPHVFTRFRAVQASAYTTTVAVLYVLIVVGGAVLYPMYVLDVKKPLLDMDFRAALGAFEIKEHFAVIGLGLIPVYVQAWRDGTADPRQRRPATLLLAVFVWWNFIVGHVLTALRGVF